MRYVIANTAVIAALAVCAPSAVGRNLLQNGGFEHGLAGWSGTGTLVPTSAVPAFKGQWSLWLQAGESVSQRFATVPGATYAIRYAFRGAPLCGDPSTNLQDAWIGAEPSPSYFITAIDVPWVPRPIAQETFVATGTTTNLVVGRGDLPCSPMFDAIRVART
jgi:hypothetical protein